MPYVLSLLIGLDQLGAALFFNRNDFTISSLSGICLNSEIDPSWLKEIATLKLSPGQVKLLKVLAKILNKIQANHCSKAIASDLARASYITAILNDQILGR